MLDGMSDSIQRSRIENLHSREVDRQSPTGLIFVILHSLICRVLLLLLLLLLLCNASDLRNCTSYFGACMWVWYRPPIGAHFHPTPQPPPVPQQLGEKAHLRTVAAVLANATGDAGLSRRRQAGAGSGRQAGVGLHTLGLAVERRLVQATAVRRSHSSCYYYYYYYTMMQDVADLLQRLISK